MGIAAGSQKRLFAGVIVSFAAIAGMLMAVQVVNAQEAAGDQPDTNQTFRELVNDRAATLRQEAADRRAEAIESGQEAKLEARQAACEARKSTIASKMLDLQDRGYEVKQKLDRFESKIETYVADNALVVENYDRLLADVNAKQDAVAVAAEVVKSLRGTVDCSDPDTVQETAAIYRAAIRDLRNAAKDSVASMKTLAQAVRATATERVE